LKIETTSRDDHQVRIVAEFETEFMDKFKRQAARKISQDARVPGFRPGKAPYDIIRRMYGDETIEKEAVELMLDEVYVDILKEAAVEPGGPGNLEEIISYDPPKFAFLVPLMPKVELGDYQSLRKDFNLPATTEEQIEQVVKNLRTNYSTAEPVERPAQEGDLVAVKISGSLVQPQENDDPIVFKENSYQMIVGENEIEEDDWPYEGFTRELVGLSANEQKSIVHDYPQDYVEENLRGKQVALAVTVETVKSLTLPEVNDEFAQSLGGYANLEALRTSIRENLEETARRDYENTFFTGLIDEIIGISSIKYPPHVLDEEVEHVLHSLSHDLEDRKMDLPTYLKTLNKEKDAFVEEEIKPVARRRLERSLVMDEIGRAESIKLNPEDLQREVAGTIQALQSDPQVSKLRGEQAQSFAEGLTMETASRMLNHMVMERLKAIVTGEAEKLSELETVSASEPADEATQETPQAGEDTPAQENSEEKPTEA
jgi:trigger factor